MSQLFVTSPADRATSSRCTLGSLARGIGDRGPRDNESLPLKPAILEPADETNGALGEDTARRLSELLEQPGVNGALIADLLGYNVVDDINHGEKDPNHVAR